MEPSARRAFGSGKGRRYHEAVPPRLIKAAPALNDSLIFDLIALDEECAAPLSVAVGCR